jgi:alpha-tubulin suppressor-like RCC1 family protein
MLRRHLIFAVLIGSFLLPAGAGASVYRWGLGLAAPTPVPNLAAPMLIDAGNADGYAIAPGGVVKAWGSGKAGALGDGRLGRSESPVTVGLPSGVQAVSLGEAERSGFAVTSTGNVYDWGENKNGDLCQGVEQVNVKTPEKIAGLSEVVAVQGAEHNVMFLLADGQVKVCGWNNKGEIGLGEKLEVGVPTLVPGLSNVVEISAGPKVSAVRLQDGEVLTTGTNVHGQLGLGEGVHRVNTFTRVPLPGPASEISVGGDGNENSHSLALVQGVPYGWGFDEGGEIGDGSEAPKYTPVVASELMGEGFTTLRAGGHSSCGLALGDVYCWGQTENHWEAGPEEEGEEGGEAGEGEEEGSEEGPGATHTFAPHLVDTGVTEISLTARNFLDRH